MLGTIVHEPSAGASRQRAPIFVDRVNLARKPFRKRNFGSGRIQVWHTIGDLFTEGNDSSYKCRENLPLPKKL